MFKIIILYNIIYVFILYEFSNMSAPKEELIVTGFVDCDTVDFNGVMNHQDLFSLENPLCINPDTPIIKYLAYNNALLDAIIFNGDTTFNNTFSIINYFKSILEGIRNGIYAIEDLHNGEQLLQKVTEYTQIVHNLCEQVVVFESHTFTAGSAVDIDKTVSFCINSYVKSLQKIYKHLCDRCIIIVTTAVGIYNTAQADIQSGSKVIEVIDNVLMMLQELPTMLPAGICEYIYVSKLLRNATDAYIKANNVFFADADKHIQYANNNLLIALKLFHNKSFTDNIHKIIPIAVSTNDGVIKHINIMMNNIMVTSNNNINNNNNNNDSNNNTIKNINDEVKHIEVIANNNSIENARVQVANYGL